MVGVFENLGAAYISPSHKDIYYFLLDPVLMFKPSGLLGLSKSKGIVWLINKPL